MKQLLTGALIAIFILALVIHANVQAIPVYRCSCKIDETLKTKRTEAIICNDFYYQKGFTYIYHGDTATLPNAFCYCVDDWGNHILPIER